MLNSRLVFTRRQGGEGRKGSYSQIRRKPWPALWESTVDAKMLVLLLIHALFREYLFICDNVAGNVLGAEDTGANKRDDHLCCQR